MHTIDGSRGEGGGQILRSSLTLSLATRTPVRLRRIRAKRSRPGLRAQHVAAVRASAAVGDAEVQGVEVGSQDLVFAPRGMCPGEHVVDVGTAGSATLVAQTVAVPLLAASGASRVIVHGGTHNPAAPPADFLEHVFLATLRSVGARARMTSAHPGFAPAGGGRIEVEIEPSRLASLDLARRGDLRGHRARALLSGLPHHVAERELDVVRARLGWDDTSIERVDAAGPGNALLLETRCANVTQIVSGFGRRGVPAEQVADGAVREHEAWWAGRAAVGPHLADQLLVPLALHRGGRFTTSPLTSHFTTNAAIIADLTGVRVATSALGDGRVRVTVEP